MQKSVSRAERINQALQALYLVGAGLLNAIAVQLTTLPVVESKAANIGDGVLALGHLQTAESAGEVIVLAIAAVVLHLRKPAGVNQRGSGGRKSSVRVTSFTAQELNPNAKINAGINFFIRAGL